MERKLALGGRGRGPFVPTPEGATVLALGVGEDTFTVRGLVDGGETDAHVLKGDGRHTSIDWDYISIEYQGTGHPIFFIEND